MKRIFNLLNRHKSLISYAFFGVCTTAANVITYDIFYNKLQVPNIIATIIAWVVAVIFAFITNKLFVFSMQVFVWGKLRYELVTFWPAASLQEG